MLQSVSLSAPELPAANPRRKIDRKAIEGLAASIKQDGILHNFVVTPTSKGKKQRYQIVSGARRLEAPKLLQERGKLPKDFTVAVEIRDISTAPDGERLMKTPPFSFFLALRYCQSGTRYSLAARG